MKKVSVVMCTYNGCKYIGEQLDSLARQTYSIHEIIIQDDKSTDNTVEIIKDFQSTHQDINIRLYINQQNKGFNRNFLSAILRADGDYIACCDQDDIWEDIKLETLVNEVGDAVLIFHNSSIFDGKETNGLLHKRNIPEYPSELSNILSPRSYGHQIMFRKDIIETIRPYSNLNISYDYFINTISSLIGKVKYTDKALVKWRRHNEAATYSARSVKESKIDGYKRALAALFRKNNIDTTRKYFNILAGIHSDNKDTERIINKMSKISIANIVCICYLCLKHKNELATDCKGFTLYIRALFIPLFFIRDYGQYIIKEK